MKKSAYTGDVKEIVRVCDSFFKAYENVTQYAFDYFLEQPTLTRMMELQEKKSTALKDLNRDFYEMLLSDLADFLIFCSPKHIASFSKMYGDVFDKKSLGAMKHWKEKPFFWSAFTIEKCYKNNMFTIVDIFTGDRKLLVSKDIEELLPEAGNDSIFLSMMFSNGSCVQTAGIPLLTALSSHDLSIAFSFLNSHDASFVTKEKITQEVLLNYFIVGHIANIPHLPNMENLKYDMRYTFSQHTCEKTINTICEESPYLLRLSTSKELDVYTVDSVPFEVDIAFFDEFDVPASFFSDMNDKEFSVILLPSIYVEKKSGEVFIDCLNKLGYSLARLVLNYITDFPMGKVFPRTYPEWEKVDRDNPFPDMIDMHMALYFMMERSLDAKYLPWIKFTGFLEDRPTKRDDDEAEVNLGSMNFLLDAIATDYNHGREIDIERLADEFYIPLEDARVILKESMKQMNKYKASKELLELTKTYPLVSVKEISPFTRKALMNSIVDNEFIVCIAKGDPLARERALQLMKSFSSDVMKDLVRRSDFDGAVQILSSMFFPEELASIIANSVLYIMCKEGDTWVDVRAICANILINFEFSLMMKFENYHEAIEGISLFIYTQLCSSGLFELKERVRRADRITGTYSIKLSELFTAVFALSEEGE